MTDAVVSTSKLTKRYGHVLAVDRLDLGIRAGEVFGLLGPNGAGKTTTILMLLGLSEPTSGEARVLGLDPVRDPLGVKRRVGYLPEEVGFYGSMTGRENLRYTARLNGLGEAERRLGSLLDEVGLGDAADRRVDGYSHGMRQRLGIADALVKEPEVLILDEPTIGIDPTGTVEILELIRRLARDHGITILLSSHLLHQVQAICDRVGIFVGGRLVAAGMVDELAERVTGGRMVVEVGVGGDPGVAARGLPVVDGVEDVEMIDGGTLLVTCRGDIRPAIADELARIGVPLAHLRRRGTELDEIYARYFEARTPAGARS